MLPTNSLPLWKNFLRILCFIRNPKTIFLPLAIIGIVGFAVNYSVITFVHSGIENCHRKVNIVFLKTHKCAGSSIQNILMRYGDTHNMTFALPPSGNYISKKKRFEKKFIIVPHFRTYNILAHHTRFDYQELKKFMPPDSIFITIIRHPVQLFESLYTYYTLYKFFDNHRVKEFSRLVPTFNKTILNKRNYGRFGTNQMLFDLGASPNIFYNDSLVQDYIDDLESQFHLVMIAERMDESLILLKNLLCWNTDDIVAFKVNARDLKYKHTLTQEEKRNLAKINHADMMLYQRFVKKFADQAQDFGLERLQQEVNELKSRREEWSKLCIQSVKPSSFFKHKYHSNPFVLEFQPRNISNSICQALTRDELAYTDFLRNKQKLQILIQLNQNSTIQQ